MLHTDFRENDVFPRSLVYFSFYIFMALFAFIKKTPGISPALP